MMIQKPVLLLVASVTLLGNIFSGTLPAGELSVGSATASITPDQRVALSGQMYLRVSAGVESPCTATALSIETCNGDQSLEQAIFISCDLVGLYGDFYGDLRQQLQGRIPEEVLTKLVINATHTHTGPVMEEGEYVIPESGVMPPAEYREFLMKTLADLAVQSWEARSPARVAWGLGYAVVAHNRRAVYSDGTATMYGKTDNPKFRGIEGSPDSGVEILYFWDDKNNLIATAINVSCPSQEVEHHAFVNADFWHQVREKLREKYGKQLNVLAWCGAAGDQSPHLIYRKAADERMRKLRGIDALNEIAQRIVNAWEDVYQVVQEDRHQDVVLEHQVATVQLPYRKVTPAEADAARREVTKWKDSNDRSADWRRQWNQGVVKRYEQQQTGSPNYEMVLHAVRLGDVVIVTNDFELFTDYGVQMKARSPALQTFVIQLCGGGTYLPSERAVAGGGYSAIPQSNIVGPEGGQVLVEKSVGLIKSLWPSEKKK